MYSDILFQLISYQYCNKLFFNHKLIPILIKHTMTNKTLMSPSCNSYIIYIFKLDSNADFVFHQLLQNLSKHEHVYIQMCVWPVSCFQRSWYVSYYSNFPVLIQNILKDNLFSQNKILPFPYIERVHTTAIIDKIGYSVKTPLNILSPPEENYQSITSIAPRLSISKNLPLKYYVFLIFMLENHIIIHKNIYI